MAGEITFSSSHFIKTFLQAHEIRAICSGVEAPFQLIILIYLIFRWNDIYEFPSMNPQPLLVGFQGRTSTALE